MFWLHETYGWSQAYSIWEAVRACGPRKFHMLSTDSLCRISITRACPLCFHKGHAHVDVIWARAEAIRDMEHIVTHRSTVARTVMCRQDGRGRFPVLLDDHSKNVGQTHKENPNLIRFLHMVCTLNDIYKQYNKLHEHWYTKISSLRCVEDRNPPQNASDFYMKYWSYAEHCRLCTRLSGVNWWKQKNKNNTNCSYRIFIDCRSPVSPVFWARILLTYLFLPKQSLCTNFAITR